MERLYGCGVCGKMFRYKLDLNHDTKLHTGDAQMCSICGKVFTKHPNLNSHVQTHTGERPHLCHTCGIPFIQKTATNCSTQSTTPLHKQANIAMTC